MSPSSATTILNSVIYQWSASLVSASSWTTLRHTQTSVSLFLCHPPVYLPLQAWCSSWVTCKWSRTTLSQNAWHKSYWSVLFKTVYLFGGLLLCFSTLMNVSRLQWDFKVHFSVLCSQGRRMRHFEMKSTARSSSKQLTTQTSKCLSFVDVYGSVFSTCY